MKSTTINYLYLPQRILLAKFCKRTPTLDTKNSSGLLPGGQIILGNPLLVSEKWKRYLEIMHLNTDNLRNL